MKVIEQRTVDQWVDYIQTIHAREIEMGLDRVDAVYQRLIPAGVDFTVISVAGTNGKGSTAELLSSIFEAADYTVGKFSSPHLVDYGERYCINGHIASDQQLLAAFERIEHARGDIPLTFFEFGTLMAIELFYAANVAVAIMEVGLGGRLDAVNILDADIALITSISIDHTGWLGNTIDEIAPEKMGIARRGRPCVIGLQELTPKMRAVANDIGMHLQQVHKEFTYSNSTVDATWSYQSEQNAFTDLPLPFGQSGVQLTNASLAVRTVELLSEVYPIDVQKIRQGITQAQLSARCQIIATEPYVVLDVAHNESSIARLATFLTGLKAARCIAVCGMLRDKEIAVSLSHLRDQVDEWHLATINSERGASAQELEEILTNNIFSEPRSTYCYANVGQAYTSARKRLSEHDVLVVFGSFFIAGDILALLRISSKN